MTSKLLVGAATILLALNLSAAVERHALVIGNANYQSSPLRNPLNDARDMAAALKGLGFQVQSLLDADAGQMEQAIIDFNKRLNADSVGLFYFAGHGIQAQGNNYLIPLRADISSEVQLKHKAINAGFVLDAMESANNGVNIVILDACRDNPYESSFRSSSRGLAPMNSPKGSLIAYATAPGSLAADGDGRNGLFTQHLLAAMQQPNQLVELTFKDVAKAVSDQSNGNQTPFVTSSLTDDFYFKVVEPEQFITITLRSNVYDDQVYINGSYVGSTKLVTQLAAGWHDIEVRKTGYKTYSARLLLDEDQTLRALLQPLSASVSPQKSTTAPIIVANQSSGTIDGLSLGDWLLLQQVKPATIASLDKIMGYERQHGSTAASRSYVQKGLQIALAGIESADDLLEYQRKFSHLPGASTQIEARLAELVTTNMSREELLRLREQFPASETLRLELGKNYHRAGLLDAAANEYQSWLGLTDSNHSERKLVLEAMLAAREGKFPTKIPLAVPKAELIKLIGSTHSEYTKLDAHGNKLPSSAPSWSCVLDNRSGLIWEVKTNGGARSKDDKYRWGGRGVSAIALGAYRGNNQHSESRWDGKGNRHDDWNTLIDAANSEQLCGFSDWRVPDLYQLASLVRCRGGSYKNLDDGCSGSYQKPTIDTEYFPNAQSSWYWSASPNAYSGNYYAWRLYFGHGSDGYSSRNDYYLVRLVRSGQ